MTKQEDLTRLRLEKLARDAAARPRKSRASKSVVPKSTAAVRAPAGAKPPKSEYLADAEASTPWVSAGVSRATYFKRKREMADPLKVVEIDYTNHRGERRVRKIMPIAQSMAFENSEWHPETQWTFEAIDMDKGELRTFAMAGIHSWKSSQ